MSGRDTNNPQEFMVCIGMDAMRLALGKKPRNFTLAEVIRWLRLMSKMQGSKP